MLAFPGSARFAFTIIDDTDVATVENVGPVYKFLEAVGIRATKTVWPVACPEGSEYYSRSQTLEDADYREFVLDLQRRGFEIASHGATMESSARQRVVQALERFRELFGTYPRVHANHAYNRDNVYWGEERLDDPLLRHIYRRLNGRPRGHYQGHVEGSPHWWGDLCARHVQYVRNLTFPEVNLLRLNPSMPYHDPRRPLVRWWFSATDAEDADEFNALLTTTNQERLQREGGVCIVATHLAKGYAAGGRVSPVTEARLRELAARPGWFPTVGDLLDWLRGQGRGGELPPREWKRMQWAWARGLAAQKWRRARERRARVRATRR